jgi:hypothetical protein
MQDQSPYGVPLSAMHLSCRGAAAIALGTVDTAVILWPTFTDAAGVFTHASAVGTGSIFTVVRPGIYRVTLAAALAAAGDLNIGLSLNAPAASLTVTPVDFATAGVIGVAGFISATAADLPLSECSRVLRLAQGDVLRTLATVGVALDVNNSRLFIDQIAA